MNLLILKRYNLLGLLVALISVSVSVSVNSQEVKVSRPAKDYIQYLDDGGVRVEIGQYCHDHRDAKRRDRCEFVYKDIEIEVGCINNGWSIARKDRTKYLVCYSGKKDLEIASNQRIVEIRSAHKLLLNHHGSFKHDSSGKFTQNLRGMASPWYKAAIFNNGVGHETAVKSIVVLSDGPKNLSETFVANKQKLLKVYENVLFQTFMFKDGIAKSHQGHLERYIQSLRDGIAVLKDKKEYSLLDWRVQESSRRVVAFGVVISEILEDYEHVERLGYRIETIRLLTSELQKSYGWNHSIAGNVSKASGALLELLELELTEIGKTKLTFGFSNLKIYSNLIQEVKKLTAKVNSSRSGDMAAQREVFSLMDTWNSDDWQDELTALIEAPIDFKKMVSRKLSIMLMAVEGISDMTNLNFVIPTNEE